MHANKHIVNGENMHLNTKGDHLFCQLLILTLRL